MAQQTSTCRTTLPSEEVLVQTVQFFTNEKWRVQTQSARTATFIGKGGFPWRRFYIALGFLIPGFLFSFTIIGMIVGIPLIIVGAIFMISARLRWWGGLMGSDNLAVTVTPLKEGTDVNVTYTKQANKLVSRFLDNLPK